ncbi:MAG: hypothetical protein ACI8ZM_004440 [Crocinitomix sp.]|jgi:hypothetical protein
MKFEKLGLKKFEPYALKAKNLKNCFGGFGGQRTAGGTIGVGQGVRESYADDTLHENGAVSWEHTDFMVSESPGAP